MRAQLGGDIVDAESCGGRVGEHARDERSQLTTVVIRRLCLLRSGGDERSDAATRFDDARPFELGVHAGDSVGVDAEIHGELPYGGQLFADREPSGGDGRAEAAIELRVDGRAVLGVDGDERAGRHVTYCTNSLEQVNQKKA